MTLATIDYIIIIAFFLTTISIGISVARLSGRNMGEYFLSGRSMPWWLLGVSMVATTFSTDTPNLVANIVREDGVSGNWNWWAFLITGLMTVFIYAKLWRRSNVATDMEFYEMRYSGAAANFLRSFRSVYLGVIFNILAMSAITLAAIKISHIMLGLSPITTVVLGAGITVIFSSLGGFRGVVYTDFLLFFVAMGGAIGAAYYSVNLPEVGGLSNLITHPNVIDKINIIPDLNDTEAVIGLLIIPLAVQWWSSWYPGGEPGGGGYIAQRMLAAKNESHAIGATFFFNIMHYAVRPWPWLLVALASLVIYPDLASIHEAFPDIPDDKLGNDLAYSAMLTKLPSGLLGLVLTSLIAAYMSTISTHLNWGSSYIVNDLYLQRIKPKATQKELVMVGRLSTFLLMLVSAILSLFLTDAYKIFKYIVMFGAGTGLIFLLRWFWWRINAWSEITAMFFSGIISLVFSFDVIDNFLFDKIDGIFPAWAKLPLVVLMTTVVWLLATFMTKPDDDEKLISFYKHIQPGGRGWNKILLKAKAQNIEMPKAEKWTVPSGLWAVFIGCVLIYSMMFSIGYWLYSDYVYASVFLFLVFISCFLLIKLWLKIKKDIL